LKIKRYLFINISLCWITLIKDVAIQQLVATRISWSGMAPDRRKVVAEKLAETINYELEHTLNVPYRLDAAEVESFGLGESYLPHQVASLVEDAFFQNGIIIEAGKHRDRWVRRLAVPAVVFIALGGLSFATSLYQWGFDLMAVGLWFLGGAVVAEVFKS
jgi:hypothetical protein